MKKILSQTATTIKKTIYPLFWFAAMSLIFMGLFSVNGVLVIDGYWEALILLGIFYLLSVAHWTLSTNKRRTAEIDREKKDAVESAVLSYITKTMPKKESAAFEHEAASLKLKIQEFIESQYKS